LDDVEDVSAIVGQDLSKEQYAEFRFRRNDETGREKKIS
jgi:hypothetical protein